MVLLLVSIPECFQDRIHPGFDTQALPPTPCLPCAEYCI